MAHRDALAGTVSIAAHHKHLAYTRIGPAGNHMCNHELGRFLDSVTPHMCIPSDQKAPFPCKSREHLSEVT